MSEPLKHKKVVYVDMDNVLVNFQSGLNKMDEDVLSKFKGHEDDIPNLFSLMDPVPGAIDAFNFLSEHFDAYILTTSPWENITALQDKRNWVKKHLPEKGYKRLIITHHKNLNKGDYIIDDRTARGVDKFEGEHIHFDTKAFPDWKTVLDYLCDKENIKR
jgi:5'-nucleotidase